MKDFEVKDGKKGLLTVKYIGENKDIDKCICILSPKFATYHLIEALLKEVHKNIERDPPSDKMINGIYHKRIN